MSLVLSSVAATGAGAASVVRVTHRSIGVAFQEEEHQDFQYLWGDRHKKISLVRHSMRGTRCGILPDETVDLDQVALRKKSVSRFYENTYARSACQPRVPGKMGHPRNRGERFEFCATG
jgi:hypothetical protein